MSGWLPSRAAAIVVGVAAVAVTAGYQFQRAAEIPAGSLLSALTYRDFYGDEAGVRWSRGSSTIVFPGAGPERDWTLALEVSGWRPRGQPSPLLEVEAAQGGLTLRPPAQGHTLRLAVRTTGVWSSDLAVKLRSETLTPGPKDPRTLGVRVSTARLIPAAGGSRVARPPLRPVVTVALAALLLFGILAQVGVRERVACAAAALLAAAFGGGFACARPWAALASGPAASAAALGLALTYAAPAASRLVARALAASARAFGRGVRGLGLAPSAVLAVVAVACVTLAHRAAPTLDVDLGSGHEAGVARGFGPYDSKDGATFREGHRGSVLDLSDAGSGTWAVRVNAWLDGAPRQAPFVEVGDREIIAALAPEWKEYRFSLPVPLRFSAGAALEFPSGARIDRVVVERGGLPSPRAVVTVLLAGLLVGAAVRALGLPRAAAIGTAAAAIVGAATALALDPVASLPFLLPWLGVCALGAVLAALAAGTAELRGGLPQPWPIATAAAVCGFLGRLAATTFPLYAGGHFTFHSSIAEEIWKGRFLVYYLPFPGSMLSQQAQWGNIVVPHPCLEQTLMAPLAALPHALFYAAEKIVLALWLAALVVIASALAVRLAGARAGAFAALATATLVPTYQLLGLGHLMTILGVLAASLAMTFLVYRIERLSERATWWTAVALLTFCFLSYFAALLFTGAILALIVAGLWRRSPLAARRLAAAVIAAAVAAFGLYYVNWAIPFLSESVPRIFSGSGGAHASEAGVPLLRRLLLEPRKWDYSYGSLLVPALGIAGLALAPRSRSRGLVLTWALVLAAISGADLFFNFLLKHHYFLIVPVGAGLGVLLAWCSERGVAGRVAALVLLAASALLGAQTAVAVAFGRIP